LNRRTAAQWILVFAERAEVPIPERIGDDSDARPSVKALSKLPENRLRCGASAAQLVFIV
jgi:hypothetical protein